MKPEIDRCKPGDLWDAPSRGHDLKRTKTGSARASAADAPSRGHDLKLRLAAARRRLMGMPPHGGMT